MTAPAATRTDAAPDRADRADRPDGLDRQVRHGLTWSFVNNVVVRAGQVVVGVVLARLLTPYSYGVFAAALVAYAVLISCSELGVTVALVSRRDDAARIGPTVTTLSWASSAGLTLLLWLAAPALARQLHTPDAAGLLRVLSLSILVAGLAAVPGAVVQRDFQQRSRFAADLANFAVATTVAIVGVRLGGGAMALAWSRVAANAVSSAMLAVAARDRFWPGFRPAVARELLRFGLPLAGASAVAFAVMNVDYVVVARTLGPVALGYYMIAFNLSGFPVSTLSTTVRSVSLPAFGRLRDSPAAAGAAFATATRVLVSATALVSVLLAALAWPLIRVVYGGRWLPAAAPLVFLAGLGLFRVFHELAYDYLAALGRSRLLLGVQLGWLAALVVLLPLGASRGGLAGIGVGHLVAAYGLILPAYLIVLRRHSVRPGPLLRGCLRPAAAALAGAAAGVACLRLPVSPPVALLAGGAAGTLAYLGVIGPALPGRWRALSPWTAAASLAALLATLLPGTDAGTARHRRGPRHLLRTGPPRHRRRANRVRPRRQGRAVRTGPSR